MQGESSQELNRTKNAVVEEKEAVIGFCRCQNGRNRMVGAVSGH